MTNTNDPDPLLSQIPLIKSPFYSPPQPIRLGINLNAIPSQLPKTIQTNSSQIREWIKQTESIESNLQQLNDMQRDAFNKWRSGVEMKVAPGYFHSFENDSGILTPSKINRETSKLDGEVQEINEALAKTSLE